MKDASSSHLGLQNLIDCYLETNPPEVLQRWADNNWKLEKNEDIDDASLKYLALVLLNGIESRAQKIILEKGCPALIVAKDTQHMLPAASESLVARGLEMLREICGMEDVEADGILSLGIRNDRLELNIKKSEAVHTIYLPAL
jgi:hypothetical protein